MIRIVLFLITNIAVMLVFSILLNLSGIQLSNTADLMVISGLLGVGGALISLLMSKRISLNSVNGELIKYPRNETEQWLIDTIDHQAKQVNISTPQIALYSALDMNAFATGARRDSSLIAVSTGLLKNMNRNEIEAVIAHEISHIVNGDMVTMTLIQGVINTFVIFISRILTQLVSELMPLVSDNKENTNENGSPAIYLFISTVLELAFGTLASVITLWFSRHREFKADANSARMVGVEKMIAALQTLKNSSKPHEASNIITLCINGRGKIISELFMSHPPLEKRIAKLKSIVLTKH